MEISRNEELKLTQAAYTEKIVEKYKMSTSKTVDTPLIKEDEMDKTPGNEEYPYRNNRKLAIPND